MALVFKSGWLRNVNCWSRSPSVLAFDLINANSAKPFQVLCVLYLSVWWGTKNASNNTIEKHEKNSASRLDGRHIWALRVIIALKVADSWEHSDFWTVSLPLWVILSSPSRSTGIRQFLRNYPPWGFLTT